LSGLVADWFGDHFNELDPLLRRLHLGGGQLSGTVAIGVGAGIAGVLGRWIAAKLGVPTDRSTADFRVDIRHVDGTLHWAREFNRSDKMLSVFTPYGCYPNGFWRESTGSLSVDVEVRIVDGGWYWIQRRTSFLGLRLPIWLFPASHAYKRIVEGRYEFSVSFTLPLIGNILTYGGTLDAT
jgi:hypothetical protein